MNMLLITSILAITLALVCYTVGVWAEHKAKILKLWQMAKHSSQTPNSGLISLHGITGALAIILMLIHVMWALLTAGNKESFNT